MKRLAIAVVLLLVGCATAPAPGPVLLKGRLQGRLEGGIYHDKLDWFDVATPIPPGDPGYASMGLDEENSVSVSYVSFILAKTPGEFYHAYVEDFYATNHPVPSMDQVADSAMKVFGAQMIKQRTEPMRLVEEKPWRTTSTSGLLRLYTERTPTELLMQNLGMAEDYTAYILMYVTAQKGKVAVLWSEWPMDCQVCVPPVPGPAATDDDPIDKALAANGRSQPFMDSFHYHAD
ncbi:MAG TPA: hypothetical protein VLV87_10380 [Gammaproteobacteria bacterium]|nr:hypothetical protein [Gammaproteobacteria bacterium]